MLGWLAQAAGLCKRRKRNLWTLQSSGILLFDDIPIPVSTSLPIRKYSFHTSSAQGDNTTPYPIPISLDQWLISKDDSPITTDQNPYLH